MLTFFIFLFITILSFLIFSDVTGIVATKTTVHSVARTTSRITIAELKHAHKPYNLGNNS